MTWRKLSHGASCDMEKVVIWSKLSHGLIEGFDNTVRLVLSSLKPSLSTISIKRLSPYDDYLGPEPTPVVIENFNFL